MTPEEADALLDEFISFTGLTRAPLEAVALPAAQAEAWGSIRDAIEVAASVQVHVERLATARMSSLPQSGWLRCPVSPDVTDPPTPAQKG